MAASDYTLSLIALAVAVLTSVFLGGVFPIYYEARVSRFEAAAAVVNAQLVSAEGDLLTAQATYLDALMNVSALQPIATTQRSGTCTVDCGYQSSNGASVESTWHLDNVQMGVDGALDFTVLVVDAPSVACEWPDFGAVNVHRITLANFGPDLLAPYALPNVEVRIPLSESNKARIDISTQCFALGACTWDTVFTRIDSLEAGLSVSLVFSVVDATGEPGVVASPVFQESLHIILPLV